MLLSFRDLVYVLMFLLSKMGRDFGSPSEEMQWFSLPLRNYS
ncbi:hypothetical protein THF5H11_10920 [Vibrio jasicida]|nr:hypothetical protein THF5H11_10920 [Vibrio jasicida]